MLIDEIEQKTIIRFENVDDFENFVIVIDNGGYESDEVIFTGWLHKLNSPEITKLNRFQ